MAALAATDSTTGGSSTTQPSTPAVGNRICSLCRKPGHLSKSHCKNFPICPAVRNQGHLDTCEYKKTGCGKPGCTIDGHHAKSHCIHYPTCTGLRGEHDDSCPGPKAEANGAAITTRAPVTNMSSARSGERDLVKGMLLAKDTGRGDRWLPPPAQLRQRRPQSVRGRGRSAAGKSRSG